MPRADHLPPDPDVDDVPATVVDPGPVPPPPEPEPEPVRDPESELEPEDEPVPESVRDADVDPVPGPPPEPDPVPAPPEPTPDRTPRLPMRPVRRIPASGERFGGFTLGESLGHGGFAHVYRAEDDDGEPVALKVLTGLPDDARERFAQEADLLARVDGRGFPRFVAADPEAPQPWFAMELVPGSTLLERVRSGGPLPADAATRMLAQVVDALLVLQEQRCLHRDLKPANIMIDDDRAVLIDLGIAKIFDAATSTQPAGTVSYMAPELFGRRVHPRSDVYSLGLLLVFTLAGALPPDLNFLGRDLEADDLVEPQPGQDRPELDKHLLPLILAMTRYQPAHRPPLESIRRVVQALLTSEDADPTLLLTDRLVADGVTRAERAVLPATEVLGDRPTKVFGPGSGPGVGARAEEPGGLKEPWHGLVYDRELMRVLSEVHGDGFDGAAAEVIADHVAEHGVDSAQGHTPAEIKDWIWQAMRWDAAAPPDPHADTLRGWRAFRKPEPAPTVVSEPVPGSIAPRPNSMKRMGATPRSSSVRRMGPVPPKPSPVVHLGPTPPPPAVRPRPAEQPQAQPQTQVQPQSQVSPRPAPAAQPQARPQPEPRTQIQPRQPQVQPQPQSAPQPRRRTKNRPQPQPQVQPGVQPQPQARPQPQVQPQQSPRPRRGGAARRFFGALLRMVPRLVLVAALGLAIGALPASPFPLPPTPLTQWLSYVTDLPREVARFLEAPALAAAAAIMAALLRAAGHRMHVWFYILATVVLTTGAVYVALEAAG